MGKILHLLVYTPMVALADLLLIYAGFFGMDLLRHGFVGSAAPHLGSDTSILFASCLLSLTILHLLNLYGNWVRLPPNQLLLFTGLSALLICMTSTLMVDWQQQCPLPLALAGRRAVAVGGLLMMYRLLLRHFYWSGVGYLRVMVVALNESEAIQLIRKLAPVAPGWMEFVGYLVEKEFDSRGNISQSFDVLLLAPGLIGERALIEKCAQMQKKVMAVPALMEMSLLRGRIIEMQDLMVVELQSAHLTRGQNLTKRVFDLALATVLLVFSGPPLLIIAAIIRFTSNGPAVFKQDRVGRDGVEYQLYKLRTMISDAEKHTGPVLAQECDPRITGLGHFLRATRIDELPQLINVLKGNMSIIGPRPERQFFVRSFQETLPDYHLRFAVKPGITGLAQVAGSYSTPVEQKLKFDLLYISNYSVMRDIWILLRTIPVIFHGQRAGGIKASSSSSIMVEEQ